ncbi:hypothetical protein MTBPR1_60181 [Candidatus Terasakiella magnetica]|uniref:Uncharacterized protein n=1 Tax=Candidatus Terasakiella magnetica TaxID=1867952 RepID=A0A1C3RK93_9PROT|nr:hypothetical protein [Candidatus Terasakiella magnetica]SCA57668.1 hypothetical protein MTBPR1_60181 [Candidatus Terasakiella magnetica]
MHIDASLSQVLLNEQENLSRQRTDSINPNALVTPAPSQEEQQRLSQAQQRYAPKDIVEFQGIEIDLDNLSQPDDGEDFDIRNITPREMVDFSLDLYIDGSLSYDEYSMMAFQPELHPKFENTVGALTGERSDPDRPRDFIQEWEDKYNFERRYPSDNPKVLQQIDRILGVLNSFETQMDFVA